MTRLRLTPLAAALVLGACATQPRQVAPVDAPGAAQSEVPCENRCTVVVSNPSRRPLDIYFSGMRGPQELLGTVNANGTARFTVPLENAGWVFVSASTGPRERPVDSRRLMLQPGQEGQFRINTDRMH